MDLHNEFLKGSGLVGTWALVHRCDEIPMVIRNSGSVEHVISLHPFLTIITKSD